MMLIKIDNFLNLWRLLVDILLVQWLYGINSLVDNYFDYVNGD